MNRIGTKKFSFLKKNILVLLAIKGALLFLLWAICFSHPIDKKITHTDIIRHLISG